MLVSILHRATGQAMALGGVVLFLWWLIAAATGPEAYAFFMIVATSWLGLLVGIGTYLGVDSFVGDHDWYSGFQGCVVADEYHDSSVGDHDWS